MHGEVGGGEVATAVVLHVLDNRQGAGLQLVGDGALGGHARDHAERFPARIDVVAVTDDRLYPPGRIGKVLGQGVVVAGDQVVDEI